MSFGPLHKNALMYRSAPITKVIKRGYYALGMRKRSLMVPAMATAVVFFPFNFKFEGRINTGYR